MKQINLLPRDLRPNQAMLSLRFERVRQMMKLPAARTGALALALLLLPVVGQSAAIQGHRFRTDRLRRDLKHLQLSSGQLKTQMQEMNVRRAGLLLERTRLENRQRRLVKARQPPVPISTVLTDLVGAVPEEVWITKLSLSGETLKKIGRAHV